MNFNLATTLGLAAGALALASCSAGTTKTQQSGAATQIAASYSEGGDFIVPDDWRTWVHVASTSTPNELNGGAAPFPGMHNTYIDPVAYDHWTKTGEFSDGTVFIKELVDFVDADHADGSSDQLVGRGYYPNTPILLGVAVKDTERFASEPNGWSYFVVPVEDGKIAASGALQAQENCSSCHQASAADTDFVFLEYYPNLRRVSPRHLP